jgi:hypothetical protein
MLDFILVPDALTANQVRASLAQHSIIGVRVGHFASLLDILIEQSLLPTIEDSWSETLQTAALCSPDTFWAASILVDEAAVLSQLEASLLQLLLALPLNQTLNPIAQPQNKPERYYNDLVYLHQQMLCLRPLEQMQAQTLLQRFEPLDDIQVHLLSELFDFEVWQQDLIDFLQVQATKKPPSVHHSLIQSSLQLTLPDRSLPFAQIAERLFSNTEAMIKPATFSGILCRDQFEECTALASMVQQAFDSGSEPTQIAVIYPARSDYPLWLHSCFSEAGIGVSNLPQTQTQYDWVTALLRELMVLQYEQFPSMAWKSVLSNPLMPWANSNVASRIVEAEWTDSKNREKLITLADKFAMGLISLLRQSCADDQALLAWLSQIADHLQFIPDLGFSKKEWHKQLEKMATILEQSGNPNFEVRCQKLITLWQPNVMQVTQDKVAYLNSVTFLHDQEFLPFCVKHLFVIGFNQGAYAQNVPKLAKKTVINHQGWSALSAKFGFKWDTFEAQIRFSQQQFKHNLSQASDSLTILAAQQSLDGGELFLSETALDLALCFAKPRDAKPEDLFTSLAQTSHPFIKFGNVAIQPKQTGVQTDLRFEHNLLTLHNNDDYQRAESPSSLEKIMVSPLAWVLDRQGLNDSSWQIQTLDIMLQGTVAHKVFELYKARQGEVFSKSLYQQLFDQAIEEDAAFLQNPLWRMERTQLFQQVQPALQQFSNWLHDNDWKIIDAETHLTGTLWGLPVSGYSDAILQHQTTTLILDYKKSKSPDRIKRLAHGFDLQTYIYRSLYQQMTSASHVHSGYYNLNDCVLVLDESIDNRSAMSITVPDISLVEQSQSAIAQVKERLHELANGQVILNTLADESEWAKVGIKAYALKDNLVIKRFMKPAEEGDNQ